MGHKGIGRKGMEYKNWDEYFWDKQKANMLRSLFYSMFDKKLGHLSNPLCV